MLFTFPTRLWATWRQCYVWYIFVFKYLVHSLAYCMCWVNTELMNSQMNKHAIEIFIINSYFIMKWNESLFKGTLWKIVMYNAKSLHYLPHISYIKFTQFDTIQKMHRLSICCLPLTAKVLRNKEEWEMVLGANFTSCSFHSVIDWHPCYGEAGSVPSPMKMSGILWLFHPTEHKGSDDTCPLRLGHMKNSYSLKRDTPHLGSQPPCCEEAQTSP